ncbi:MAG: MFS transporter [Paracoccaceae bacterium]|nr:MFS transporter [Paracoccaceae bacterium]
MTSVLATREGRLTCAWYGALFFAFGAHLPYWPVWLADWGLSEAEIATYLGLALIVRVIGSVTLPALADRFAARRIVIAAMALLAAMAFIAHLAIESRSVLLLATLFTAVAASPMIPLGEALGVRAATRHGFAYAHARAAGSLAFLAMNLGLGALISIAGPGVVVWAVALNFLGVAALGLVHPGGGAPPGMLDQSRLREAVGLLGKPVFLTFALAASIGQASHAVYYVYATLNWTAQGIDPAVIGALWAVGVAAEILLMLGPGRHLVARLGPARALGLAGLAGIMRWAVMSLEPGLAALWPVQALHAFTFGLAHLGAMAFVAAAIPPRLQASAQGIYGGGMGGTAIALATLAAGAISAAAGPASAYWLAAGMSAAAVAASFRLAAVWDGREISSAP